MASNKFTGGGCFPFFVVGLFLLFTGLKLAEVGVVATWSWWWVTSPLWIYLGLIATVCIVVFGAFVIVVALKD